MLKSWLFWSATIMLALFPIFILDISEHYISYKKEVREEFIMVAHDTYQLTAEQKAQILDQALSRNIELNFLMYTKGFSALLFLIGGIIFLKKFHRQSSTPWLKVAGTTLLVIIVAITSKFLFTTVGGSSDDVYFITPSQAPQTLSEILKAGNIRSKVVYVDFWGTTCGPCLMEFRNFTKPVKKMFNSKQDISYLYISRGQEYLWKKQIDRYRVDGYHIFLSDQHYDALFRHAVSNDTATVFMPRYLIVKSDGEVIVAEAKRPSDGKLLFDELAGAINQIN